jgi:hypothetical protein
MWFSGNMCGKILDVGKCVRPTDFTTLCKPSVTALIKPKFARYSTNWALYVPKCPGPSLDSSCACSWKGDSRCIAQASADVHWKSEKTFQDTGKKLAAASQCASIYSVPVGLSQARRSCGVDLQLY